MISDLFLAFNEVSEPRQRRRLLISIGLAIVLFVALWSGLSALLLNTKLFDFWVFDAAIDLLGGIAAIVLTWLLFPAISTALLSLFLDGVVEDVEARYYPGRPPARVQPLGEMIFSAVRLLFLALLLNLLALPLYIFLPGINLFLFYGLNGYLIGREYFELVALRRLMPAETTRLRRADRLRVVMAGAVIAFLLTIPFVNLAAPLIGAAFMVHVFERSRVRTNVALR